MHRDRLHPRARLWTAAVLALAACASCGGGSATEEAAGTTSASSSSASSSSGAPVHCPGQPSDAPVELAPTLEGSLSGIAVDGTDVYWVEGVGGPSIDVFSCSVCGCDKKPKLVASLESTTNESGSIALDETSVYFAIRNDSFMGPPNGAIMKCAKTGCGKKPTVVASAQAPNAIAVDATSVYWINEATGTMQSATVMKCPKEECDNLTTVVALSPSAPAGIAVDAKNVYWTSEVGGVLACSIQGCLMPKVLATFENPPLGTPISIAVDGSNVFWALDQTHADDRVMSCAVTGCSGHPTTLASKQSTPGDLLPGGLAVDEENVYWSNATELGLGGDGELMKCAKSGCGGKPTVLASEISEPGPIAVDATSVYTRNDYTITKVPK